MDVLTNAIARYDVSVMCMHWFYSLDYRPVLQESLQTFSVSTPVLLVVMLLVTILNRW